MPWFPPPLQSQSLRDQALPLPTHDLRSCGAGEGKGAEGKTRKRLPARSNDVFRDWAGREPSPTVTKRDVRSPALEPSAARGAPMRIPRPGPCCSAAPGNSRPRSLAVPRGAGRRVVANFLVRGVCPPLSLSDCACESRKPPWHPS